MVKLENYMVAQRHTTDRVCTTKPEGDHGPDFLAYLHEQLLRRIVWNVPNCNQIQQPKPASIELKNLLIPHQLSQHKMCGKYQCHTR